MVTFGTCLTPPPVSGSGQLGGSFARVLLTLHEIFQAPKDYKVILHLWFLASYGLFRGQPWCQGDPADYR